MNARAARGRAFGLVILEASGLFPRNERAACSSRRVLPRRGLRFNESMPAELTSEQRVPTKALGTAFVLTWLPSVTMMLLTTLSYIDRNTLAILAPTILRDTGLSN